MSNSENSQLINLDKKPKKFEQISKIDEEIDKMKRLLMQEYRNYHNPEMDNSKNAKEISSKVFKIYKELRNVKQEKQNIKLQVLSRVKRKYDQMFGEKTRYLPVDDKQGDLSPSDILLESELFEARKKYDMRGLEGAEIREASPEEKAEHEKEFGETEFKKIMKYALSYYQRSKTKDETNL